VGIRDGRRVGVMSDCRANKGRSTGNPMSSIVYNSVYKAHTDAGTYERRD
jgi:hypothetical protein